MLSARNWISGNTSLMAMDPAWARAAYSPREKPAAPWASMPWALSAAAAARSAASTQGWVLWVRFNSSWLPSKHSAETLRPSAASAASNTALAAGSASYRSFIMPGNWAPWPENISAIFMTITSEFLNPY